MDNHESHVNISIIELAKRSGIILMTFHPHTTHKMQPLDRGVFGPFKTFYNNAMNNWMISPGNAGKPVTIYDISYLVGQAYPHAFVPNNIVNSFKCTGFFPFNENIFTEIDFLPATVTVMPIVDTETCVSNDSNEVETTPGNLPSILEIVSPEIIQPHPKAKLRKAAITKRHKGKLCILTDTPEMKVILHSKSNNEQCQKPFSRQIKSMAKQIIFNQHSDTSLNNENFNEIDFGINILDNESENSEIVSGSFSLAKLNGKKYPRHYVAEVIEVAGLVYKVKYLKKSGDNKFIREDDNIYDVELEDIIMKVPPPSVGHGSCRRQYLMFDIDLTSFTVQ